ncbi:MAG: HDOD domain-containing protein [Planctomycetes bacterium]|nr:HDOD domain-containing protein [Planctomycetota bacterium]
MDSASTQPKQDIFVGRQPIYGRRLELYAYELLYRGADVDYADFSEGDRATSQVLLNTFTEFGLERIVGGHLAFINLTRGFIVGEYPLPVPRTQVVLEVLEDVPPDEQVIEGLKSLRQRGFKIALDDFDCETERLPLLALADIVKLDILGLEEQKVRERFELLKPLGLKLLAEKIETREQFELCRDMGFDYFQGYFLAKPNVVSGQSIPANNLNLLRLMAEFQSPDHDLERVAEIVSQDVALSYKLLRHINAAIYGMPRRIDSVKETVTYLGLSTVKNLACLFILSGVNEQPRELLVTAMMRAKMCELLGRASKAANPPSYFTMGLFSTLDALLNVPMDRIVKKLPLSEELQLGLLEGRGPMAEALRCTLAYERGDWDAVDCFGLSRSTIKNAFLEAVIWVEAVDKEIAAVAA